MYFYIIWYFIIVYVIHYASIKVHSNQKIFEIIVFYYRKSILLFLLLIKISYIYKIKIVQIKSENYTYFFKYRNIDFIFSFFLNRDVLNLLIKILDRYFNQKDKILSIFLYFLFSNFTIFLKR